MLHIIAGNNHEVRIAEFLHELSADAAWPCSALGADDGDGFKLSASLGDCLDKRGPFRADCRAERGILDIAAGEYLSVLCQQSGPHPKF